jgi:hypothetical protein
VNEINILENQLKRMRSMNKFYHLEFLKDVRYFFAISIISLIISFNNQNVLYLLPLISLFGSVMLAFHAYFLIFSRNYSEYLEKKINKQSNSEIFITYKLENSYFFPIQDKKIVVAKFGKEFSWFSFVTLFITFYGVALYVYAVYNLVTLMNSINYLVFIIILTLITFSVGYWWFVNNVGESRLRSIYDE